MISLSNGSPGTALENLRVLEKISSNIKLNIKKPIYDYEKILIIANEIVNLLDSKEQEFLIDYIQLTWWRQTNNKLIAEILENIKTNLKNNIQSKLSWETGLLKIALLKI